MPFLMISLRATKAEYIASQQPISTPNVAENLGLYPKFSTHQDAQSSTLLDEERALLRNPNLKGIILFKHNYQSKQQLKALCTAIKNENSNLIIAVDHEGGKVWRFEEGFTRPPAAECYGLIFDGKITEACDLATATQCTTFNKFFEETQNSLTADLPNITQTELQQKTALALAQQYGYIMAQELRDCGVDLSFAPIYDLLSVSKVIAGYHRAFHRNPEIVALLAGSFGTGMRKAGMAVTGKHFPGHGSTEADSHFAAQAVDNRSMQDIQQGIKPFKLAIEAKQLDAIMFAHVIYPAADPDCEPAGYSKQWDRVLEELNFKGARISDCLSMESANIVPYLVDNNNPSELRAKPAAAEDLSEEEFKILSYIKKILEPTDLSLSLIASAKADPVAASYIARTLKAGETCNLIILCWQPPKTIKLVLDALNILNQKNALTTTVLTHERLEVLKGGPWLSTSKNSITEPLQLEENTSESTSIRKLHSRL